MTLSNNVAQGGQTFLHKVRMLRQVLGLSFRIGFAVFLLVFGWCVYKNVPSFAWGQIYTLAEANAYVWMYGNNAEIKEGYSRVRAYERAHDIVLNRNVCVLLPQELWRAARNGVLAQVSVMLIAFLLWYVRGRNATAKRHLGGSQLIDVGKFKKILQTKGMASDITIGKLPMVKNSETQHMMITGTTGSGKTNCFHHLLPQIRRLKQRALIVDTTGEFVSRYFRPGKDILLNPLDARSEAWNPWIECEEDYHFEDLAANLIPQTGQDPFWSNAARTILSEALIKFKDKSSSVKSLLELLNKAPLAELSKALKDTNAFPLVDPNSEKTASSIRATLSSSIKSLGLLEAHTKPFSIRNWVHSASANDQWLFLSMTPDQRQVLRPLISAWTSTAIKSLMGRMVGRSNKLWIVMDELPSLNKLGDLQLCLAEGRKYGAAMVLGVQNIPQLMEIYGMNITKTILDLCSTKVMFRASSQEVATSISNALGYQEVMEVHEGISYGANDIRDGVNLSQVEKRKPIVTPEDLINLRDLEAYISLPGYPYVAKEKFKYFSPEISSPPFIHRKDLEKEEED